MPNIYNTFPANAKIIPEDTYYRYLRYDNLDIPTVEYREVKREDIPTGPWTENAWFKVFVLNYRAGFKLIVVLDDMPQFFMVGTPEVDQFYEKYGA